MSTEPSIQDRLKRDVAFHLAAQRLADAVACREQRTLVAIARMDPQEREWFKQASRQVIETFEQSVYQREPDAVGDAERREAERQAAARQSRLGIERSRARLMAGERGHELGPWHPGQTQGSEMASCARCGRKAIFDIDSAPMTLFTGSALNEGCLVAASEEGR